MGGFHQDKRTRETYGPSRGRSGGLGSRGLERGEGGWRREALMVMARLVREVNGGGGSRQTL